MLGVATCAICTGLVATTSLITTWRDTSVAYKHVSGARGFKPFVAGRTRSGPVVAPRIATAMTGSAIGGQSNVLRAVYKALARVNLGKRMIL